MKCIIIYFSQTGNTELIANAIKGGVKNVAGYCDIVTIKDANPRRLYEYDLIGLGCPVMHYEEPDNVKVFIKDMRFVGNKHVFVFATHGTRPEFFFPSIFPKLQRRGLTVIGMYSCYATYHGIPTWPTAGHPDAIDLKEAEKFGGEMVKRSRMISAGQFEIIPPIPVSPEPGSAEEYRNERQKENDSLGIVIVGLKIQFLKEKCTYPECRLCMENCPMDGIDLTVGPPMIARPCMDCGFCTRICPTGALFQGLPFIETSIKKLLFEKHYVAPLVQAEAEGRFRRLVPVKDIDPGESIYGFIDENKHPQWVIGKGMNLKGK